MVPSVSTSITPTTRPVRRPRTRRGVRLWNTRVHRWTGFALMAWFVFEALTGSYLAIGEHVEQWRRPGLFHATAGDVGVTPAVKAAVARVPGTVSDLVLPVDGGGVYQVTVKDAANEEHGVFVDPGTGTVNGTGERYGDFFVTVLRLHADLAVSRFLGISGSAWVGWLAVVWLVNLLLGLLVLRRRRRALRPGWAFRRGRTRRAFHLAVHNWVGLWTLVPAVVLIATGLVFEFPSPAGSVISALTPGDTSGVGARAVPYSTPTAAGVRVPLATVVGEVTRSGLGTVRSVEVPVGNPAGVFTAYVDGGGYSPATGGGRTLSVYVDQYTGKVLSVSDPVARSAAVQVRNDWVPGLHFGTFAGWFSQLLWVLFGLGTLLLALTALVMRAGRYPWQRGAGRTRADASLDASQSIQPELESENERAVRPAEERITR